MKNPILRNPDCDEEEDEEDEEVILDATKIKIAKLLQLTWFLGIVWN